VTTLKTIQLICDGRQLNGQLCTVAWQPDLAHIDSAAMQRRAARAAGWKVEQKGAVRDLCPGEHQAAG
jgi:hypothetical protein